MTATLAPAIEERHVQATEVADDGRVGGGWRLTVGVATLPVLVAVVAAVAGHAWGVPRTDDWAFARVAYTLHDTGHLHLVGWSQMNLVGLVVWAQPWLWAFGDSAAALDASAAALIAVGLVAAFRLGRRAAGPRGGVAAVGVLVVFPGFLRDIPTFMTDGPALAVQAIVLAVGAATVSAVGRRRTALMCAVVGIGFFGFTIREFAIAAPLAVLGALVLQRRRGAAAGIVALLASCGSFYVWRQALPGAQPLGQHPASTVVAMTAVQALCTVCLGLIPILAWTWRGWRTPVLPRARRLGQCLGLALATLPALATRFGGGTQWLVGHYLDRAGVNGNVDTLGVRPDLLPQPIWVLLNLAGIAAMVVVCGLVADALATRGQRPRRPTTTLLVLHVTIASSACVAAAALNGQVFDRYLWPVVLSAALLVLRAYGHQPAARLATGVSLVAAAALAVALTLNSNSFDAARWDAGRQLVASGVPAQAIDAGFEWTGAHAGVAADLAGPYGGTSWWTAWYPHPPICAVVAASPISLPGFELAGTRPWNLLGIAGSARLYVYRSVMPYCPAARA